MYSGKRTTFLLQITIVTLNILRRMKRSHLANDDILSLATLEL